ncbi:MAG: hypothetical protein IJU79_07235 [Desulfovibrionaceae bacterium]|nr:hypothetical protein [Desulfovibrionaceae bacterium]
MEICLATIDAQPVMLQLKDGNIYIDGELQPIKYVTESEVAAFAEAVAQIPVSDDPGYAAKLNCQRANFITNFLLGRAVGEECIDLLTHILDHLHYDILEYLGETGD